MKRRGEMHINKWKKSVWKDYILYDSNHMTFGEGKIMAALKKSVICQGLEEGREGKNRWNTVNLGGSKNIVWYYNDGYKSLYIFPNRMYNAKSKP